MDGHAPENSATLPEGFLTELRDLNVMLAEVSTKHGRIMAELDEVETFLHNRLAFIRHLRVDSRERLKHIRRVLKKFEGSGPDTAD